jgi:hypothetical protein
LGGKRGNKNYFFGKSEISPNPKNTEKNQNRLEYTKNSKTQEKSIPLKHFICSSYIQKKDDYESNR